ncbi:MAG: hypothetical protein GEV28_18735 [Actinophytocola sp.]|nr:hypothetical protein [Actinophytocola sp.]
MASDCLAGKGFEHAKIQVRLTLPATTASGVDDKPGHLAGYGWLTQPMPSPLWPLPARYR